MNPGSPNHWQFEAGMEQINTMPPEELLVVIIGCIVVFAAIALVTWWFAK